MADQDEKLINVVVKYSTVGAESAATDSDKNRARVTENAKAMTESVNKASEEQVRALEKVRGQYNKTGQEIESVERQLRSLKSTARDLGQVGNFLAVTGGLITAPALLLANNYVKTMGEINSTSAEWLQQQRSIEQSTLRIGESTTQALLPGYKLAADFIEKIANVVQDNPWIVQGAVYAGGAMVAIGGGIRLIAEITKVTAEIGLLLAKLELSQAKTLAANQFGGFGTGEYMPGGAGSLAGSLSGTIGTVTLLASSVIIGAELGVALGNYLGKLLYGETYEKQNLGDALITFQRIFQLPWALLASALAKLDPSLQGVAATIMDVLNRINQFNGKLVGASEFKEGGSPEIEQQSQTTQQMVQAFIGYKKQINDAQATYSAQRAEIIAQYEQQVVDSTERYESQRGDILRNHAEQSKRAAENFTRAQASALETYERSVAKIQSDSRAQEEKAVQEYRVSAQRNAQAHNLEMARLEAQHESNLRDAAGNRDALAIVKENESFALARSQKEQDFRIQETQRREDFQRQQIEARSQAAQQLAELKANYDRQKQEREAEFLRQQAESRAAVQQNLQRLDEAHKKEMEKLAAQEKDKLTKLGDAYKKQVDQIQTAFIDRLRALDATILGDTQAFTRYMQDQAIQFQNWLTAFKAQANTAIPREGAVGAGIVVNRGLGREYGGYASFQGPGESGRDEFVMSNATTKMAEALVGGRLNQENIMQGIMAGKNMAGGSSNRSVQIIVQSRNLTLSEIHSEVDQVLNQRLADLLPAFGA